MALIKQTPKNKNKYSTWHLDQRDGNIYTGTDAELAKLVTDMQEWRKELEEKHGASVLFRDPITGKQTRIPKNKVDAKKEDSAAAIQQWFKQNNAYAAWNRDDVLKILKDEYVAIPEIKNLKKTHVRAYNQVVKTIANNPVSITTPEQDEAVERLAKNPIADYEIVNPDGSSIDNPNKPVDKPSEPTYVNDLFAATREAFKQHTENKKKQNAVAMAARDKEELENPALKTERLKREAAKTRTEKFKDKISENALPAIESILNSVENTYNQQKDIPPQQRAQFGGPTDNPIRASYNNIVNAIRPDQTGFQKTMQTATPYASELAGLGAGALGGLVPGPWSIAAAPLAKVAGKFVTSKGMDYLAQPSSEFSQIGNAIYGKTRFGDARRGLGNFISGQDQGFFPSLARTLSRNQQEPSYRQKLGNLIGGEQPGLFTKARRGLGSFIGQPGLAGKIGTGIDVLKNLYDIADTLGVVGVVKRKFGPRPQELSTGEGLAYPMIFNSINRAAPYMRDEAERMQGRKLGAQDFGFNKWGQEMYGNLAPAMNQYDINQANYGMQKAKDQLDQEQAVAGGQMDQQRNAVQGQRTGLRNANEFQNQFLDEEIANQDALYNAEANRQTTNEIVGGLRPTITNTLQPIQRQPNAFDTVGNVANDMQNILGQFAARGWANNTGRR